MLVINTTTTTKVCSLVQGRRIITRICLTRHCVFTSGVRNEKEPQKAHAILQSHLCFLCFLAACEAVAQTRVDYSRFSHLNENHKLECQTCHKFPSQNWKLVRKESDAFPDIAEFPDHQSCIECHRKQFFARERPAPRICSNCHVKASPRDTSRFPFPSLGEQFFASAKGRDFLSEFKVSFPHDKHQDTECASCHETYKPQGDAEDEFVTKPPQNHGDAFWLKKGTFKSLPLTHSNCFTCHNQESELAPTATELRQLSPARHC